MTRKTRVSIIIAGVIAIGATMCYTLHRSDRRAGIAEVRCRDKVMNFERSNGDCANNAHLTPIGAFDFQEVAMATKTCQHMIVMCAKTHQACVHAKYDGECECSECGNESLPTFRQMGELYLRAKTNVSKKSRDMVLPTLGRIAWTIGLGLDSKVALGVNEWELIYKRLTDGTHPFAHEGAYDPATVKQWFSVFTRCAGSSDWKEFLMDKVTHDEDLS